MSQPNKIPQIVLTGGPASGKSTTLRHLKASYPQELVLVDEAATIVLESGQVNLPSAENPWTPAWQKDLQARIAKQQHALESQAIQEAQATAKRGIVQDRGFLDGAAYLPDGIAGFERLTGLNHQDMLKRYHTVIYLGWLGSGNYETESNPARFEDEIEARAISERILESWSKHPNLIEITTHENRAVEVASIVKQIVGL